MAIEIFSRSISTKGWGLVGMELATPRSAVRQASAVRHVTNGSTTGHSEDSDQTVYMQRLIGVFDGRILPTCTFCWLPALIRSRPPGYKTFSMLNSAEHEIYPAHKC